MATELFGAYAIEFLGAITKEVPEDSLMSEIQKINLEMIDKYDGKYSPVMLTEFDEFNGPVISKLNAFDLDLQELLDDDSFTRLAKKDMNMSPYDELSYDKLINHIGLKLFESCDNCSPYTYKHYGKVKLGAYYFSKDDSTARGGERMYCLISKLNDSRPDQFEAEDYLLEMAGKIKSIM